MKKLVLNVLEIQWQSSIAKKCNDDDFPFEGTIRTFVIDCEVLEKLVGKHLLSADAHTVIITIHLSSASRRTKELL